MKILLSGLFFFALSGITLAQQSEQPHQMGHGHEHHRNELAVGSSFARFINEDENSLALHMHYTRNLGNSGFGAGIGFERIFDEHGHNIISAIVSYRFFDRINLSLAPGVIFEDEEFELNPSFHMELTYDFEVGDFHLGPMIGYGIDPEDSHIGAGIHLGYGF